MILPGSHLSPSNEILIAPGAEMVGQSKIVDAFSKPFELAGLFNAADAGAFGTEARTDGDELMVDGETYWDADERFGDDDGDRSVSLW